LDQTGRCVARVLQENSRISGDLVIVLVAQHSLPLRLLPLQLP
jgi:hypothetical protein